jgi:hypothetical protein
VPNSSRPIAGVVTLSRASVDGFVTVSGTGIGSFRPEAGR